MSFKSIVEFLDSLSNNRQDIVDFMTFMEAKFPNKPPKITYSMPMWWASSKLYEGYIGISAAREHYSIHFGDEGYIAKLKAALPSSGFGKRCVNVKYGDEETIKVVKKFVQEYFESVLK